MPAPDHITQQRLDKLQKIREQGVNPYPNRYQRTHTTRDAAALFTAKEDKGTDESPISVSLAGRITALRLMGKLAFLDIRDGSGKIQLLLRRDSLGDSKFEFLHQLDIGDFVGAGGKLFRTRTGEITLEAADYTILSKSLSALPEKWHGLVDVEKRYRQRYLDLISNIDSRDIFLRRSRVIRALRTFLDSRDFIEVETPVLQPAAGGAMARPFITHHHALDQELFLRIALELYLKRLIVGGFDRVYELARVFRNEGISIKHNPEFTMMECYQAYADYNDMMKLVEDMVSTIATEVTGSAEVTFNGEIINLAPPWKRITLRQAVCDGCGIDFEDYPDTASLRKKMEALGLQVDPTKDRGRLVDELVSTYVEPQLKQPTFLLDYPVEMSPLAKKKPEDPRLVERFEAFIGTMEVANSFTELNDPLDQEERFRHQLENKVAASEFEETIDDDFLQALKYGMPPTGGLGVGIDRLVMLLTDKQSIREVILFPQLKSRDVKDQAI